VTREAKRQTRNSSGIPGKNIHGLKIPWATRETNGKTRKPPGKPGKIDHDFRISSVTRETNRQAWNSSGKFANFLEIAGNLKKLRRKFRNRQNSSEAIKIFCGINKKFLEIDEKFLEVFKISNASLRKKRNRWIFFRNAEIFFEIDKKFKVVVKISGSLIRESRNHWNSTMTCKKIDKSLTSSWNRCNFVTIPCVLGKNQRNAFVELCEKMGRLRISRGERGKNGQI
jgi:hypothetical protein